MGDIQKSFEKLMALREILKAGEVARDGHATIGANEQLAKPIQAAKAPDMPIAKSENQEKAALLSGNPKLQGAGNAEKKNISAAGDKQCSNPVDRQGAGDFAFKSAAGNTGYPDSVSLKHNVKTSLPAPTHGQPIKNIKATANPKKVRAYLKVQKAIVKMQGWQPMDDVDVKKAFSGNIPQLMAAYGDRPSNDWFDRAVDKSSGYAAQPQEYAMKIWYGMDVHKDEGGSPWAKESGQWDKQEQEQERAMRDAHQGMEEHENDEDKQREMEELKRWLPGAVANGGWKALREHPSAGPVVRKCAEAIGKALLGSSNSLQKSDVANIDAEELGEEILGILDDMVNQSGDDKLAKAWGPVMSGMMVSKALPIAALAAGAALGGGGGGGGGSPFGNAMDVTQKAVAEPIGDKYLPNRKRLGDAWDGQSKINNPMDANVNDVAGKGKSKKIDTY